MGTSQSNTSFETLPREPFPREPFPMELFPMEPFPREPLSALDEFKKRIEELLPESTYPFPDAKIIQTTCQRPTKPAPQSIERIALNAEPIGGANEDVVNSHDGRTQIQSTAKWPHSVHGVVVCKINGVSKWGTGTMIGPNVVLTAAHNLYSSQLKAFSDIQSIQFLPGMNGQLLPFGPIEVERYFVSPNYLKEGKEDYAVLLLKEPIGEMTGYFGLICLEPKEIKKKRINVTGYPGDKVASKPNTYEMWGMSGIASHIDEEKGYINYLIDTSAGQSGSGVWYQEGDNYYVCGVHVSGDWCVNRATLLTRNAYRQIHEWLHGDISKGLVNLKLPMGKVDIECVSLLLKYKFEDVRILNLQMNQIGDEEVKALAKNTSWVNLSVLGLGFNEFSAEGAKALSQNTSWINLHWLVLRCTNIGAEGAKALSQNNSWINLSILDLASSNISDEGAQALAQNISWTNLSSLQLFGNNISDEGAKGLAKNTSWVNLSKLDLEFNPITAEGAEALKQNKTWKTEKVQISGL